MIVFELIAFQYLTNLLILSFYFSIYILYLLFISSLFILFYFASNPNIITNYVYLSLIHLESSRESFISISDLYFSILLSFFMLPISLPILFNNFFSFTFTGFNIFILFYVYAIHSNLKI